MATVDEVRMQAMNLTATERALLAQDLLQSLDAEATDIASEQEWLESLEKRCEAYERGELTARDWRESVEHFRPQTKRENPS